MSALTVVVRRGRIQIETPRGPTRGYGSGAARCLGYLVMRPPLIEVLLPYFQDADPILASALAGLVGDAGRSRALADGLAGAANQLSVTSCQLPASKDRQAAGLGRDEARVSIVEDDGAAD
jgi:hypothetical protein